MNEGPKHITLFQRIRASLGYYVRGLVRELDRAEIFLWSQAIAFKVLVTVVPLLILGTGLAAQILQRQEPFETVANLVRGFLPDYESDRILAFITDLQQSGDTLTIIGVAALLIAATTLFTTLRVVINNIFQEDWHISRTILLGYAFDFRMVVQVGLLFILTVALAIATQAIGAIGQDMTTDLSINAISAGWRYFYNSLSILVTYLVTTAMFFQLYYFIPQPHPPWKGALTGAITAGVLWELAKWGFTLYATRWGRFDHGIETLADTFGLLIAFVLWAYYSGLVLNIGGLVALLYDKRHRTSAFPTPLAAERLPETQRPHEPVAPDSNTSTSVKAKPRDAEPDAVAS